MKGLKLTLKLQITVVLLKLFPAEIEEKELYIHCISIIELYRSRELIVKVLSSVSIIQVDEL